MSNELLQKVVDTVLVGSANGGLLNTEQADRFIDYMWDETVLSGEARKIRLTANERDIDKVAVGRRVARKATEGIDTGVNAKPTFSKVSVTTEKLRLDWEITTDSLEDNIAGGDLEDHIVRLMANQFGTDLEDLAINGDTTHADPLLKTFDGYRKLGKATGHVAPADTPGDGLNKNVFNQAIKLLPRKWLQRKSQLRFYTSPGLIQDFVHGLTDRETLMGDDTIFSRQNSGVEGAPGMLNLRPYGIPIVEIPLMSEGFATDGDNPDAGSDNGYLELTFPANRIWATKREVQVHSEFKPKKDAVEYTVYVRFGVQIEETDGWVHINNITVQ